MMKRHMIAFCIAAIAISGCNQTDGETENDQNLQIASQALYPRNFGVIGGLPWVTETTFLSDVSQPEPQPEQFFGRTLAIADVSLNGKSEVISSIGSNLNHGKVEVITPSSGKVEGIHLTEGMEGSIDNYGAAIVAGKFCPNYENGGYVIVSSAPDNNSFMGTFGIIYKLNYGAAHFRVLKTRRSFTPGIPLGRPGTVLAVGDLDNDGTNDLIYQSMPVVQTDTGFEWAPTTVSVIYDFCTTKVDRLEAIAPSSFTPSEVGYGSALYVKDLDNKGTPELLIVDNEYSSPENSNLSPEGAIFFFKYVDGKLTESRKPIIGNLGVSGAKISSIAFSDIDGDGDLDLIVGEPYLNTNGIREGRVRTYTNPGNGKDFNPSEVPAWSATGGNRNMQFGSSVLVDDLNYDGVDDLIVGAPGTQDVGSIQAYVYVYLGTKDGSVFSKTPIKSDPYEYISDVKYQASSYWQGKSDVPARRNDGFGLNLATIDFDARGWKDIVIAAPYYAPSDSQPNVGRIHIFSADTMPCYTADKCLVDNKCYDPDDVIGSNPCHICDPKQHNFDLSLKTCTNHSTNACITGAECRDNVGCVDITAADGTNCGTPSCSASAAILNTMVCKSGACTTVSSDCGDYVCNPSLTSCPTSCNSDKDCRSGLICKAQKCTEQPANNPPVAVVQAEYFAKPGSQIQLNASKSYDPDRDTLTFLWTGDTKPLNSTTSSAPIFRVPDNAAADTIYYLNVKVTDPYGASDSADTKIVVLPPDPINQPPYVEIVSSLEVEPNESVRIDAVVYDPDGDKITLQWTGSGAGFLSSIASQHTTFTAPSYAVPGTTYELLLYVEDDKGASATASTTITIKKPKINHAPEISLADAFTYVPGEKLILDASRTSDPDGDNLSFWWTVNGKGAFSDPTSPAPEFTALDALDNNSSVVTLTVTDGKAEATQSATITTIVPADGQITISHPESLAIVPADTTFTGTAKPDSIVMIVDTVTGETICGAHASPLDGEYNCSVTLAEGEHSFVAYMLNEYGGQVSKALSSNVYASSVTLKTPAEDSIYSTLSIIYSGTAEPGTNVEVHLLPEEIIACTAVADVYGFWSCDDSSYREPDIYQAYAINTALIGAYNAADPHTFTVIPSSIEYNPTDGYDAKGGSCSATPNSPYSCAPFALLACGAIFFYRRRKSSRS